MKGTHLFIELFLVSDTIISQISHLIRDQLRSSIDYRNQTLKIVLTIFSHRFKQESCSEIWSQEASVGENAYILQLSLVLVK